MYMSEHLDKAIADPDVMLPFNPNADIHRISQLVSGLHECGAIYSHLPKLKQLMKFLSHLGGNMKTNRDRRVYRSLVHFIARIQNE